MDDKFLERLANSFDDLKERLIRIEENVKNIGSLENSVDNLKLELREEQQRGKSAHLRIDQIEIREKERQKDIKWLKGQVVVGFITFIFGTILWVMTKK